MEASVVLPTEITVSLMPEEKAKFYSKALIVRLDDSKDPFTIGSFVLTDKRFMFVTDVVNKSVDLVSVTSASTDFEYVVGLVSSGNSDIKSPWVNMMVIATISVEKDCFGLVPDNKELVQAVCIAMIELKTGRHEVNPSDNTKQDRLAKDEIANKEPEGLSKTVGEGEGSAPVATQEEVDWEGLKEEVKKKMDCFTPQMAEERYDYLSRKPISELTDAEFEERLALVERLSQRGPKK